MQGVESGRKYIELGHLSKFIGGNGKKRVSYRSKAVGDVSGEETQRKATQEENSFFIRISKAEGDGCPRRVTGCSRGSLCCARCYL